MLLNEINIQRLFQRLSRHDLLFSDLSDVRQLYKSTISAVSAYSVWRARCVADELSTRHGMGLTILQGSGSADSADFVSITQSDLIVWGAIKQACEI